MLVLSRQRDETIMIGDDIEITIVDIRGDKVRLGITAPITVPVHRKEVYLAIQRENREAAKVRMEDLSNLPGGNRPPGKQPMRPGRPGNIPVTRPDQQRPPEPCKDASKDPKVRVTTLIETDAKTANALFGQGTVVDSKNAVPTSPPPAPKPQGSGPAQDSSSK